MKKIRNILIMLILLVALLIVYLVVSPMWREDGPETTEPMPSHTVAVIDHTGLVGLELEHEGETLVFALNDAATEWNWSEDGEVPLDNMVFATLVTALNEASSNYKLESITEAQLAEYGLAEPALRVRFTFSDGTSKEYNIGNLNSFNSLYYLSESSAPDTVYMVNSSVVSTLELDIYDFVLIETPPAITEGKIIDVCYTGANDYRAFKYYPSGKDADYTDRYNWYYEQGLSNMSTIPPEYPLDGGLADTLSDLVTGLSFDECVGLDLSDEKYGFSEGKKLVIRYNVDQGETGVLTEKEYVIYLGSQTEDGEIYAHTAESKLVYTLSAADEWVSLISSESAKLSPDEIWLPNYERIDSMIFSAGENTLAVNVKNTDGKISYSSDALDDADTISALISELEGLKATSNIAYLEDDAAEVEKTLMLSVKIAFNAGSNAELEMTVTRYSLNYCLVSFNGRADQLITLEDAESLTSMMSDIFAEETKGA